METILIVDDNTDFRFNLSNILKDEGYNTIAASHGKEALKVVKERFPNLALLDIRLPEMDGMQILEEMKQIDKDLIVIMLTAFVDVKDAVKAMKLGAFDYITKPFDNEELALIIKRALQSQSLNKEVEILRRRVGEKFAVNDMMGESPQIKQVLSQVKIIAPTTMTVIVQGASGTGKELIANMIHQESQRKDKPFIAIDCGAIPETLVESELFGYEKGAFTGADDRKEGKFEQANGGTLFLDEIANLPESAQVKLLRVIEEKSLQHLGGRRNIKVDVRIIVATKTRLSEAMAVGKFRDDLFHRLNEFCIDLPLLHERRDDIPVLAKCFLDEANLELSKRIEGFSSEAMEFFLNYHWPGNVRELKNVIKKAVLLCDSNQIEPKHILLNQATNNFSHRVNDYDLLKDISSHLDLEKDTSLHEITKKATRQLEQDIIKQALIKTGGNKVKAAKILKIDRMTLYSKMKGFQLE